MEIKITDKSDLTLDALEWAEKVALQAIGATAENHAKSDPEMPVDTGRARNSITWATKAREGDSYTYQDKNGKVFSETIGTGIKPNEVYIGSNVEYFPPIEEGGRNMRARHVLKRSITDHKNEYERLIEDALRNA